MIDLRDTAPRAAASWPWSAVELAVFSPDLTTMVHASTGFTAELAALVVASVAASPATHAPGRRFSLEASAPDGTEQVIEGRIVVPVGHGRPLVVEVWPRRPAWADPGAVGPHPELARALATVDACLDRAVMLDSYLHCILLATGTEGVAVVRPRADVVHVVAAAGAGDLDAGRSYDADIVRAAMPEVLLAAGAGDDEAIVARPVASSADAGWLAGATRRTARSLHGPSTRSAAEHDRRPGAAGPTAVVYLDDDPASLELLVEYFRLLPTLELIPVRNEREAHAAIAAHRPAVVLVDAWLGDRSAEELVREILAGSQLEVPAVVILSADANASTIARFRRLGITSYLSKPIELGHLFTVVDALAHGVGQEEGNGSNARTIATSGN